MLILIITRGEMRRSESADNRADSEVREHGKFSNLFQKPCILKYRYTSAVDLLRESNLMFDKVTKREPWNETNWNIVPCIQRTRNPVKGVINAELLNAELYVRPRAVHYSANLQLIFGAFSNEKFICHALSLINYLISVKKETVSA